MALIPEWMRDPLKTDHHLVKAAELDAQMKYAEMQMKVQMAKNAQMNGANYQNSLANAMQGNAVAGGAGILGGGQGIGTIQQAYPAQQMGGIWVSEDAVHRMAPREELMLIAERIGIDVTEYKNSTGPNDWYLVTDVLRKIIEVAGINLLPTAKEKEQDLIDALVEAKEG